MVKIEIITTGDEIMHGVIVDTNTAWIAGHVAKLGHEIVRHSSVADDFDAIGALCREAGERADAVICTGGLGPTADDITVEAAARAFNVKLVKDKSVLDDIRDFFRRMGREMSPSNEKQALIPSGGTILPNRVGTAPGVKVKFGKTEFFFLPGVPKELYQIFDDSVMPWLASHSESSVSERVLRCFGMPEAAIDEKLQQVDLKNVRLSFRVSFPDILLKVVAICKNAAEAKALTDAAASKISEKLGDVIYGEGESSLSEVVGKMLAARKLSIAVAESCTGGLLSSLITNVSGASDYFERGIVSYSNRSKLELLGVSEEVLRANGAVSRETAMAMAEGVKKLSGTTFGISITGIAGPGGGTPEKPVGTVHIALATPEGVSAHEYHYNRDRIWFKQIVAAQALDLVRKHLMNL